MNFKTVLQESCLVKIIKIIYLKYINMFSIANLLTGMFGFAGGMAIVYYAFTLNHRVFFLGFIESKYGGGSGTTAYRILGVLLCIFSMFLMIGKISLTGDIAGSNSTTNSGSNSSNTKNIPKTQPATPSRGDSLLGQ
jgi:hypothetical protein